jgi:hypothetical protein
MTPLRSPARQLGSGGEPPRAGGRGKTARSRLFVSPPPRLSIMAIGGSYGRVEMWPSRLSRHHL